MALFSTYRPPAAADIVPDSLELADIGLAVEQTPAYALWQQVERAAGKRLAFPPPAGSLQAARRKAELFRAVALGDALRHWPADGTAQRTFVENYALPAHVLVPPQSGHFDDWGEATIQRLARALRVEANLPFHGIDPAQTMLSHKARNDASWSRIFRRFDEAADLHSMLLYAEDGYAVRSEAGDWYSAQGSAQAREPLARILARDKVAGDLNEVFASLLLRRPSAVGWLRQWSEHYVDTGATERHANGKLSRRPLGLGRFRTYSDTKSEAPGGFEPTPHAPKPWSNRQMAQYDAMPTLGWVYRPQMVDYLDAKGALLPEDERARLLTEALGAAIAGPLERGKPARIFYDTGGDDAGYARLALLSRSLSKVLPGFRLQDARKGYDLTQRLGDTGAASALVGVALATLAAWEAGGSAFVVNLRREDGASVLAVRPPVETYRARFRKRPYAGAGR